MAGVGIQTEDGTDGKGEQGARQKRGIALGIARGIISTMLDLGCGEPDIIDRLMLKLGCDRDAAARMVAEY